MWRGDQSGEETKERDMAEGQVREQMRGSSSRDEGWDMWGIWHGPCKSWHGPRGRRSCQEWLLGFYSYLLPILALRPPKQRHTDPWDLHLLIPHLSRPLKRPLFLTPVSFLFIFKAAALPHVLEISHLRYSHSLLGVYLCTVSVSFHPFHSTTRVICYYHI